MEGFRGSDDGRSYRILVELKTYQDRDGCSEVDKYVSSRI